MLHGGELYDKNIRQDFSVSLNPYPCPPAVREALLAAAEEAERYPDYYQTAFREAVCRAENRLCALTLTPDNVLGGNGASELLAAIVRLTAPKKALLVVPGFSGYEYAVRMVEGCEIVRSGIEDLPAHIHADTDLLILGNPNNPTGRGLDPELLPEILAKCRETGCRVIADECFFRLSDAALSTQSIRSAKKYIGEFPELFVVDAFTKLFSIPGVRIGYVLSQEKNIRRLRDVLPEWNMSVFAQRAGTVCAEILCRDASFLRESLSLIRKEREYLTGKLRDCGIRVMESECNFLLLDCTQAPDHGKELGEALLGQGILIRDCSSFDTLGKGYYRIAVKDHGANELLVKAIRNVFLLDIPQRGD